MLGDVIRILIIPAHRENVTQARGLIVSNVPRRLRQTQLGVTSEFCVREGRCFRARPYVTTVVQAPDSAGLPTCRLQEITRSSGVMKSTIRRLVGHCAGQKCDGTITFRWKGWLPSTFGHLLNIVRRSYRSANWHRLLAWKGLFVNRALRSLMRKEFW